MPEGPSIVLVKEAVKQFTGKKITAISGTAKIDKERLLHQKIISFRSWGKHFLICFKDFSVRVHFLMFGTYLVNERKKLPPKLSLVFAAGEINLYTCSIIILEGKINSHYDFAVDVMNDKWDVQEAIKRLKDTTQELVCDALLDQDLFAGVGNIIKNEVLYRVRVHPESVVKKLSAARMKKMVEECRTYSFEFLRWKRNGELKKHWLAYNKKECLRCELPIVKKNTGVKKRGSFYCTNCQKLYQ